MLTSAIPYVIYLFMWHANNAVPPQCGYIESQIIQPTDFPTLHECRREAASIAKEYYYELNTYAVPECVPKNQPPMSVPTLKFPCPPIIPPTNGSNSNFISILKYIDTV